jgi:hypothetical protein
MELRPCCLEKPLAREAVTVPQTDTGTDSVVASLGKLLVIILLFLALIVAQLFGLNQAVTAIQRAMEVTLRDP